MTTQAVRIEKVRTLYRQTAPVLVTNFVNSALVCAVLWDACPKRLLIGWFSLMGIHLAARAALSSVFARSRLTAINSEAWGLRFVVGSAVSGGLWGAAGFLLLEHATDFVQLLVSFVIGGMCAAAAGTIACYFSAFETFVYPALVPLALRMLLFGDRTHTVMALMICIFAVALSIVARVNHHVLTDAFALRFGNDQLLRDLTAARARLEQTNRGLEQRVVERSEALRVQSELLRDAQRMESVGRLAGGVAHDFNNLLTIILANLSELSAHQPLGKEVDQLLGEVTDASQRGAELVRQLLTFSRRQHTNPEVLDLNAVVHSMDKLMGRLLGNRHLLKLCLSDEHLPVYVDPTQIEQVMINLITNARDAMPRGGVVTIETQIRHLEHATDGIEAGTYVFLGVSDTGVGMDAETRRLIFDPFFTTKEVGKGTGLGLATVYGIVRQCQGQIRVTSALNQGSTFRLYFPCASAAAHGASRSLVVSKATSSVFALADRVREVTVLLVEDEPTVRKVTQRILKAEGFRVHVAESGEEALEIAERISEPIDLLITDLVMADLGGVALSEQLRRRQPTMRTLFISGYSRDQAMPAGAIGDHAMFLGKPFTRESLVTKIAALLPEDEREAEALESLQPRARAERA